MQSGDLQKVRAAVAQRQETGSEKATTPWTRWVAAAYYLNKEWKATAGGEWTLLLRSRIIFYSRGIILFHDIVGICQKTGAHREIAGMFFTKSWDIITSQLLPINSGGPSSHQSRYANQRATFGCIRFHPIKKISHTPAKLGAITPSAEGWTLFVEGEVLLAPIEDWGLYQQEIGQPT